MNIKLKSTILLVIVSIALNAQQYDYTWLHPKPQGNPIYGIAFKDGNNGWAVGAKGLVMKTTNNGEQWDVIREAELGRDNFYDLVVLPNGDILATTSSGKVMKSTDGGQSWYFPPQPDKDVLRDILIAPDGMVSACGSNGSVIISDDNGETWTSVGANNGELFTHHFWRNENECMAVSFTGLYRTTDQGTNWAFMFSGPLFGLNEVFGLNDTTFFSIGNGVTYKTIDGGTTWASVPISSDTYQFRTLILDDNHWLRTSFGEGGEVFETLNGGASWENLQPLQSIRGYPCIASNSSDRVFYGSTIGDIYYSDDFGHTVINATANFSSCGSNNFPKLAHIHGNKILAILDGSNTDVNNCSKMILRSENAGEDWDIINGDFAFWAINDIQFYDSLNGFIGSFETFGSSGIYHTTDGGFTWDTASVAINGKVGQFAFPAPNRFYASISDKNANTGALLFSLDGGQVWSELGNGLPTGNFECKGVVFPNPETGYTYGKVGFDAVLYKTTDSGNSWQLVTANNFPAAEDMVWINDSTAFICKILGSTKGLYKTVDGAANWTKILGGNINSLSLKDGNTIAAIPLHKNYFLESNDMGTTWDSIYTFTCIGDFGEASIGSYSIVEFGQSWLIGTSGNKIFRADNTKFDLKALLEGPYDGIQMETDLNQSGFLPLAQPFNVSPWNYPGTEVVDSIPNGDVVDWILLEFRDAPNAASATSGSIISQQAAFLLNDGKIVGLDGDGTDALQCVYTGTITNNLFVAIYHQNHIGVMSANPITKTHGIYYYDFTDGANKAYSNSGNSQIEIAPNVWGLYGGDGNRDGLINIFDKQIIWDPNAGTKGYEKSDYNLDGQVGNKDKNEIWEKNIGNETKVPE